MFADPWIHSQSPRTQFVLILHHRSYQPSFNPPLPPSASFQNRHPTPAPSASAPFLALLNASSSYCTLTSHLFPTPIASTTPPPPPLPQPSLLLLIPSQPTNTSIARLAIATASLRSTKLPTSVLVAAMPFATPSFVSIPTPENVCTSGPWRVTVYTGAGSTSTTFSFRSRSTSSTVYVPRWPSMTNVVKPC